jgi:hypothetical protein
MLLRGDQRIIRVFPRRTAATPDDGLVVIGQPPTLFDYADEVHISVTFSWDLPFAEKLAKAWGPVAPVKIGGPATGDTGGEFVPGFYVKSGYIIHSRGCPNTCWFCCERQTELKLLRVPCRRVGPQLASKTDWQNKALAALKAAKAHAEGNPDMAWIAAGACGIPGASFNSLVKRGYAERRNAPHNVTRRYDYRLAQGVK